MRHRPLETLRLLVTVPRRGSGTGILARLARVRDVALTLVRGRLTRRDARYELVATGSAATLERVIRLGRRWGSRIWTAGGSPA